jgi:hypothetical protein
MNFQQHRIVPEAVKRNFNLTEVANALYRSQSGISKHIKDLEEELGVELFVRKGKRLLGRVPIRAKSCSRSSSASCATRATSSVSPSSSASATRAGPR